MSKVSIIITSFLRPQLLEWNLFSLAQQEIPFDFETIVLNDGLPDETERLCSQYAKKLNVKYVFTGQRNLNGRLIYRVSGFAVNIGARLAKGEILIISCAEMFHLNNTIAQLAIPVTLNHKLLATSIGMDDRTGSFLEYVITSNGRYDITAYYNCYRLNTTLPFLMAINKNELYAVGGYDEDFTGFAFDDNDLISRLLKNGCRLCLTQARTIHLYHPRHDDGKEDTPEYLYNKSLYQERQSQIVRNVGREWGRIQS